MALAAGLRVIQRSKSIGNLFDLVELGLIHGVRGVIHHSVGLVVESCGRFRKIRSTITKNTDRNSQHEHTEKKFHEHLEAGQGQVECNLQAEKNKVENKRRFKLSVNGWRNPINLPHSLFA